MNEYQLNVEKGKVFFVRIQNNFYAKNKLENAVTDLVKRKLIHGLVRLENLEDFWRDISSKIAYLNATHNRAKPIHSSLDLYGYHTPQGLVKRQMTLGRGKEDELIHLEAVPVEWVFNKEGGGL